MSMYEDRFDLRTFQRHIVEDSKSTVENFNWWRKLGIKKSAPLLLEPSFVVITPVSVSVKRTKELRALNGWYVLLLSITFSYATLILKKQKKRVGLGGSNAAFPIICGLMLCYTNMSYL